MFERLLDKVVEATDAAAKEAAKEAPTKDPFVVPTTPTKPSKPKKSPLSPTPGIQPKPKAEGDRTHDEEMFVEARK